MVSPAEVLIVGSGPAGLALALTLVKNGITVRIIEKNIEHYIGERGAGVMPRTLEIEHFLGVYEEVQRSGLGPAAMNIFDPKDPYRIARTVEMLQRVIPTPSFPITDPVLIGQWLHQQILRQHLEKLGCHVELGCALQSLEQQGDGVTAYLSKTKNGEQVEESARFAYVVGADGGHSTVRKLLGLNFIGESRDMRVYLVDARIEGMPAEGKDFFTWGNGFARSATLRYTVRPGVFQMVLVGGDLDFDLLKSGSLEVIQSAFTKLSGRPDLKVTEVLTHAEWRPNIRIAEHFSTGRVFIVGDAAHVHAPAGAQGLNTSIQDSFNLAWKLALSLKSHASQVLLNSYESERMPVVAEMLNISTELFEKMDSGLSTRRGIEAAQAQAQAAANFKEEGVFARDRRVLQLDVNYRWSEIVFDERFTNDDSGDIERHAYGIVGHDVRAGDRAPDAPGLTSITESADSIPVTRLFDFFKPTAHTVLLLASDPSGAPISSLLAPFARIPKELFQVAVIMPSGTSKANVGGGSFDVDRTFIDSEGHAYNGYGLKPDGTEMCAVIIRPDAVVGAFTKSAGGVEKYLSTVFC